MTYTFHILGGRIAFREINLKAKFTKQYGKYLDSLPNNLCHVFEMMPWTFLTPAV